MVSPLPVAGDYVQARLLARARRVSPRRPDRCDPDHQGPWTAWLDEECAVLRCHPCALKHGLARLGTPQDWTCDVCDVTVDEVTSVLLLLGPYMIVAGVCAPCGSGVSSN